MTRCLGIVAACMLLNSAVAAGDATGSGFPEDAKLSLDLAVKNDGSGTLLIKNDANRDFEIYKLTNRLAFAFLLMDEHGNAVVPTGKAKVDPPKPATFELRQGRTHTHAFENLDFVTGTAMFGYTLEEGKTYRAVAVYRPAGLRGPGVSSNECVFVYKANERGTADASEKKPALAVVIAVPKRNREPEIPAALLPDTVSKAELDETRRGSLNTWTKVEYGGQAYWIAIAVLGDGVPYTLIGVYAPAADGTYRRRLFAESWAAGNLKAGVDPENGTLELREHANSKLKGRVILACNLNSIGPQNE